MENIYKEKYLKYKTKYLMLREQLGGSNLWGLTNIDLNEIEFIVKWNTLFYLFCYLLNITEINNDTVVNEETSKIFDFLVNNCNFIISKSTNIGKVKSTGNFYIKVNSSKIHHFTGVATGRARDAAAQGGIEKSWHYTWGEQKMENYDNSNTIGIIEKIETSYLSKLQKLMLLSTLDLALHVFEHICKQSLLFYKFYQIKILKQESFKLHTGVLKLGGVRGVPINKDFFKPKDMRELDDVIILKLRIEGSISVKFDSIMKEYMPDIKTWIIENIKSIEAEKIAKEERDKAAEALAIEKQKVFEGTIEGRIDAIEKQIAALNAQIQSNIKDKEKRKLNVSLNEQVAILKEQIKKLKEEQRLVKAASVAVHVVVKEVERPVVNSYPIEWDA